MKHTMVLLILVCAFIGSLAAQNTISLTCNPAEIFVNSLSTSSFDPVRPENQPILTNIIVTNNTNQDLRFRMNVRIKWNETEIVNTVMNAKNAIQAGHTWPLTNRDLVTNTESQYFNSPDPDVSLQDVLSSHPVLRTSLQSGFFPDGDLLFTFTALNEFNPDIYDSKTFIIRVKNINAVFLTYPGRPVGQNPPEVNIKPVTFMWNSVNTSINKFRLVIKEFVPSNPPSVNSVETGGRRVYSDDINDNVFTGFLPFKDKHFYAWQIQIGLYDETVPSIIPSKDDTQFANQIKSEWNVFRYVDDMSAAGSTYQQLMAILNMLNNEDIQKQFANGYEVTGAVIFEGQVYTGKDAVDLAKTLLEKDIEVEITDN